MGGKFKQRNKPLYLATQNLIPPILTLKSWFDPGEVCCMNLVTVARNHDLWLGRLGEPA